MAVHFVIGGSYNVAVCGEVHARYVTNDEPSVRCGACLAILARWDAEEAAAIAEAEAEADMMHIGSLEASAMAGAFGLRTWE
jgi:hypothetical protein